MKKSMILTTSLLTFFTHTMENDNHFVIVLYGTTITLSKKSLCDVANTVNLLIIGKHEQQLLSHHTFNKFYRPGNMHYRGDILYKSKDDESASDDETYKPFQEENRSALWKNVTQEQTSSTIIEVAEPCILEDGWYRDRLTGKLRPIFSYNVERPNKINTVSRWNFTGNNAILEASKDLALCYEEALTLGLTIGLAHNNIALATLSADVGFPREKAAPIALTVMTNFIRCNPNIPHCNAYDRIELFVKKRSEFAAYKTFLINYWKNPCILYCAHKDKNHFLFDIPREIIDYILQLMYPYTH